VNCKTDPAVPGREGWTMNVNVKVRKVGARRWKYRSLTFRGYWIFNIRMRNVKGMEWQRV